MNTQQNLVLVFIALAVIGVVVLVGVFNKTKSNENDQDCRTCPFCAERIQSKAVLCRYCGRDVTPLESDKVEETPFPLKANAKNPITLERLSGILAATEDAMRRIYLKTMNDSTIIRLLNVLQRFSWYSNKHINKFAVFLAALGVFDFIIYPLSRNKLPSWGEVGGLDVVSYILYIYGLYPPRYWASLSLIVAGLIIYFRTYLIRPNVSNNIDDKSVKPAAHNPNKNVLIFFGTEIDLIVFQTAIILMGFVLLYFYSCFISISIFIYPLAVIISLLGFLLTKTVNKYFGMITLLIGILYIGYSLFTFDESAFEVVLCRMEHRLSEMEQQLRSVGPIINIEPYLWFLIISIAIPHMQLLRLGSLRFGSLRGDIKPVIMGRELFVPFTSVLVFLSLWNCFTRYIPIIYNHYEWLLMYRTESFIYNSVHSLG